MTDLRDQIRDFAHGLESSLPTIEADEVMSDEDEAFRSFPDSVGPRWVWGVPAAAGVIIAVVMLSLLTVPAPQENPVVVDPVDPPVAPTDPSVDPVPTDEPESQPSSTVVLEPGEPVQLRMFFTFTGPMRDVGLDQIRGVQLAAEVFGSIHGHSIRLGEPQDELCSREGAVIPESWLAPESDVLGVIGTSCSHYYDINSGEVIPGFGNVDEPRPFGGAPSALATDAGLAMISGASSHSELTSDLRGNPGHGHRDGYFRTAPNDVAIAEAAASFIIDELGASRVGVIGGDGFYGGFGHFDGLSRSFAESLEARGGLVTDVKTVDVAQTDLTPLLSEVAASEPEVVFVIAGSPWIDLVLEQSQDVAGLGDVTFLGNETVWIYDDILSLPQSDGLYFISPAVPDVARVGYNDVSYFQLLQMFEERNFGAAASSPYFATTYDATMILLAAIEESASAAPDGTLTIDRRLLRQALYATEDFPGLTGELNCDPFGDCGSQRVSIFRHDGNTNHNHVVQTYELGE
jgi:branched-chain amino acid transport system substrate-binding protein